MKNLIKIGLVLSVLAPLVGFAQVGGVTPVLPLGEQTNIITIIDRISQWALGLLLVLAAILIIYAAYLYLTAAGNEENVGKAKNVIIYAAVAIGVGLLSRVIVFLVRTLIGG